MSTKIPPGRLRFDNRAEKGGAAGDIVLVIQKRLFYSMADIGKGGKMHHGDRLMAINNRAQAG